MTPKAIPVGLLALSISRLKSGQIVGKMDTQKQLNVPLEEERRVLVFLESNRARAKAGKPVSASLANSVPPARARPDTKKVLFPVDLFLALAVSHYAEERDKSSRGWVEEEDAYRFDEGLERALNADREAHEELDDLFEKGFIEKNMERN